MDTVRASLALALGIALPSCSASSPPLSPPDGVEPPDAGAPDVVEAGNPPADAKPEAGVCTPLENLGCKDGRGTICAADGSRTIEFECDPVQGMVCDPDGCHGDCAPGALAQSYIGCEYWPTVTSNAVLSEPFHFAVAVANTSKTPANVLVTRGADTVETAVVDAESLVVLKLPWVVDLKGPDVINGSAARTDNVLVAHGAYRLRSDRPVAAYQFNALEYQSGPTETPGCTTGCYSFSNDASLLVPTTALGTTYVVTGYHAYHIPEIPPDGKEVRMGDFVALTATADGTDIEIEASTPIVGGAGVGPLAAGDKASISLNSGDVLEIFSLGASDQNSLSGTRIQSSLDKPVQVVSGVPCTLVPETVTACDHIEESVLPLATLGRDHVVTVPTTPAGTRIQTVWIQTVEPQTTLHFDPPDVHDEVTLGLPQRLRIGPIDRDFRVWSSHPFGVTQYMHGQGSGLGEPYSAGAGDPSQSVVVPSEQFRTRYIFLAPKDYDDAFVNVVAPVGASVVLDGESLDMATFEAVGESGLGALRHHLGEGEVHTMSSDVPFGIVVYGYGMYTSYMYPGGLDLKTIQVPR